MMHKTTDIKGAIPRNEGIAIGIIDNRDNDSAYYAIYRANGQNEVDIQNPKIYLLL